MCLFLNIRTMKKSILNIGKALNKAEQKTINGGKSFPPFDCVDSNKPCNGNLECGYGQGCFIQSDNSTAFAICQCLN